MASATTPTDSVTFAESVVKAFPFATFFIVIVVIVLKNEHAIALYDMGADELGISRVSFALSICAIIVIIFSLCRSVAYYLERQKIAIEKEIIHERERAALVKLFEATGDDSSASSLLDSCFVRNWSMRGYCDYLFRLSSCPGCIFSISFICQIVISAKRSNQSIQNYFWFDHHTH